MAREFAGRAKGSANSAQTGLEGSCALEDNFDGRVGVCGFDACLPSALQRPRRGHHSVPPPPAVPCSTHPPRKQEQQPLFLGPLTSGWIRGLCGQDSNA